MDTYYISPSLLVSVEQWREQQRFPHALLFTGTSITSQIAQTQAIIQQLLCKAHGCGKCQICHWLQEKIHPDVLFLPEVDQQSIKIEDIRQLTLHVQQSSHQGDYKIAVLAPAETMVSAACHALLKTLEEPPPKSILILLSQCPGLLPATLRSRCQRWILREPESSHNSTSILVQQLTETLQAIESGHLKPFAAAVQWQHKASLKEILMSFYFIMAKRAIDSFTRNSLSFSFFSGIDEVNLLYQQVLRQLNLNVLLTLEYLFFRYGEWLK